MGLIPMDARYLIQHDRKLVGEAQTPLQTTDSLTTGRITTHHLMGGAALLGARGKQQTGKQAKIEDLLKGSEW